ncbi:Fc receptor-like protein 5 [Ctenopharyngodon idella]|uniref:Fc receptor-like protein 5 n=1 Tax=Ctenopharyngodon idella TaxID=7959 RepID=UPI00223125E8|nr:Fc receptor-like protein 5 [Ctenopharyngodon idella]
MELSQLPLVLLLISNIHSGHTEVKVQLSVSPQKWLTEGDPVTLICEVKGSSTGWTFSWFTETVTDSSDFKDRYKLLSDSSRGAGGKYTVSSATVNHTGVYVCGAEREKTAYKSLYSNTQPLWVTAVIVLSGVSPPVSLIISPSRTQHFKLVSLSLSCEDQSNSDGWTVRRYTDSWGWLEDCSLSRWGSQTGSTCTISSTIPEDTGVYWCQSESGEKYHPVNITVQTAVILESPVHPVTEGDTLTLRCLYQFPPPSILRADFYKDGSLIQNQTTEMIISTVSKSHEGFYYCKHPERGESPKSWISVRAAVILESPVHPVTEGDSLTLRCLYQHRNPSILRADFYKDGSLIQNQTTEMIISTVSKSHEGFYYCKHPERGESLKSWISVRVGVILESPVHPVTEGDTLTLRCLDKFANTSNPRADFYKDGSLIQNQTTEMIISTVSKSHEGFYYCKHPETKKESTKSWISVRERPKPKVIIKPDQHVFSGETVTLRCDIDAEGVTRWRFNWYKEGSTSVFSEHQEHTFRSVTESDAGKYSCNGSDTEGSHRSHISDEVTLTVSERPKPKVIIKPDQHVFSGETVTLRCDIDAEGVTSWRFNWYKEGSTSVFSEHQEHTFRSVTESDAGKYSCNGSDTEGSHRSHISDEVTLTVSDKVQLSVSPQKWLTEGDPVTLICEVNGSSTGWTFSWFTVTLSSDFRDRYQLLSDSSRGAGGKYTVSSAAVNHTGVYVCGAKREKTAYKTLYSNKQPLWVTGVSPPVSLIISPSRTQHFTSVSLSLSCEDQSNSDGWTVRRYTDSWGLEDCSSSVSGSQTGSTCTISSTITSHTGVYWCQSESGEKYHPVNITVQIGVILESPVHPVTEGDTLTLRCLYQFATPSILRADFYKDGSLIQNQTTEMIISTVSKSHEGFYYCKHPERGESPKSWISVRERPKPKVIIKPDQHVFSGETVTLRCDIDVEGVTRWRFNWYKEGSTSVFSELQEHTFRSVNESDAGKYSCNGSDTEGSRRSNISDEVTLTVSVGVILESPVHPVTEGDTLTLRCLNKSATPSIVRADFYKDGSLIQSQTTEMIISTVSKSHEGFYYCKHPERGESPKSWISVRASGSDGLIIGVTAGLTAVFLIIVFLVLLWRFRNNKGGRSESPSAVSQQQNISQTSEQNQSEAGYNTPLSGTAHVYDSVAINKDISTDGVSEITYAEVELKSTNKQKKEKENKDKNTESCDVLYSKLKLETDQGAGSSDATYAQVI